ncbi:MAG: hypothetical protein MZU97_01650 [Bacillus subtilis]|nr:hypothetical protein [Bacillus subtilis]
MVNYSEDVLDKEFMPYVILIEKKYSSPVKFTNDDDFKTNAGMITKTEKRMLTLEALQLSSNQILWDIGAGSGAVSVDAYKLFKVKTLLFEKNKEQCDFIKQNLSYHKVVGAELFEGEALEKFDKAHRA